MNIIQEIGKILSELLDTEEEREMYLSDIKKEMELDSETFIKFVIGIEEKFGIEVEDEDLYFGKFQTIENICVYIENRLKVRGYDE